MLINIEIFLCLENFLSFSVTAKRPIHNGFRVNRSS